MNGIDAQAAGVCRYCRCDDLHACRLEDGEPCGWIDRTRTVCSNPGCVSAHQRGQAREREAVRQATRKRTPAEIHDLIRGRRKAKKKRAA